jgi:hypothetical protein
LSWQSRLVARLPLQRWMALRLVSLLTWLQLLMFTVLRLQTA